MNSEDRFDVHPMNEQTIAPLALLSVMYGKLANQIEAVIPDGRLRALALTELEASFNWATRAVMAEGWTKTE